MRAVPLPFSRGSNLLPSKSQLLKLTLNNLQFINSLCFIFRSLVSGILYSESLLNLKLNRLQLWKIHLLIILLLSNTIVFL